jgi:uncharacterized protein (TIGR02246 family)
MSWDQQFFEPIELPNVRKLVTLRDAAQFIMKLPKAEQQATEWVTAVEMLMLVGEGGGDTAAVLPLYTDDGIFMPPYSQSAIGRDAIRKAYDDVFKELKFNVKFNIAEIVQMAPTWAYVRTSSAGTTAHYSTGRTTSEANQELFVFKKSDDGAWKIARYSFSPTNPPAK